MQKSVCERASGEDFPTVLPRVGRSNDPSGRAPSRSPSVAYSNDLAAQIIDLIENGETMNSISRMDGMPSRNTLRRWARGEGPGVPSNFRDRFACALRARIEGFVDDLLQIPRDADPNHPGELARAKLECDNRRWLLSKMIPERFGDRSQVETGGQTTAAMAEELDQLRREKRIRREANEKLVESITDEEREIFLRIAHRQLQLANV